ncbi:MAG: ParB/Srx family N-terminal domain-containing protein [Dehalococcoidia bacterium]|jgi:hypothetical protein
MALIIPPEGHTTTWDIDGEKFEVNSKVVDMILNDMFETKLDGHEHGFDMCETPSGLVPGKHCHGNQCSINIQDCKGKGAATGNFHSHPDVMSFSLADYLHSIGQANAHPDDKQLMCVSMLDKGVRCKAVKGFPPEELVSQLLMMPDNDTTRGKIKPYFTKKVTISVQQLKELQSGVPWDKLTPAEEIIANDEGEDVCAPSGKQCLAPEIGGQPMAKNLIQVAQEFIKEPSGKYPWDTKEITASVAGPAGGIGLVKKGMPELVSRETEFIKTTDIEIPDPKMLAYGEVASYIQAISPIILTQEKTADGKWKILDGRHRLAAWRAAGYKQIPVVFTKETEYKE